MFLTWIYLNKPIYLYLFKHLLMYLRLLTLCFLETLAINKVDNCKENNGLKHLENSQINQVPE